MMQMWLLWWAKSTATTKNCADADAAATTTTITTTNSTETSPSCYGSCLRKLVRKVKKQGKAMLRAATAGRPNKFECQYDPSSYSLNFDTRIDDEDYYQFYAFSSRFAANPRTTSSTLEAGSH
ncbi:hypothetical protein SLEP1_g34227 [Rubroshorea leprosula]|uniref:Uncharacterized protein n=1 Tax=Rubroshorea leprosula TaxID=152421 RepID=A0AAV5KJ55_9ROSI|nr:hypothetical protein SLEP1_g34227 [Rubroshorea leprosula]